MKLESDQEESNYRLIKLVDPLDLTDYESIKICSVGFFLRGLYHEG